MFAGQLLVATQCRGIMGLLEDKKLLHWDAKCLTEGGGHYGGRTVFEGIHKVPLGQMLVVRWGDGEEFEFKPY